MSSRGHKRQRNNASPAWPWFQERTSGTAPVWVCRVKDRTHAPYTSKHPSTMARHLKEAHLIERHMSPFTHPHLLVGNAGASVIAMAIPPPAPSPLHLPSSPSLPHSAPYPSPSALFSPSASSFSSSLQSSNSASSPLVSSSSSSSSSHIFASPTTSQKSIYAALHSANNPIVLKAAARLFATHALPHRLADSKEMRDYLLAIRSSTIRPPSRAAIKEAQADLADALRAQLIDKLAAYSVTSPISLAIDGWTNTRHHKVTNILCLCGGQAYYWCSVVNRYEKNTAEWLLNPIGDAIKDLSDNMIRITALVADNEAVNGKLYKLLRPKYPHLLLSSCAAHTIQLCVNKTLKVPGIYEIMSQVESIVNQFRKGKQHKQRQSESESKVKALIVPCDTRWSSHRAAGVRLCELQKYISLCKLPRPPADTFWSQLEQLMMFLRPFQDATDIIQADNSTLYSVYQQFEKLLLYVDAIDSASQFSSAQSAVHNIIVTNWENHVNRPAALARAWFSFDPNVRNYDTTDLTATKRWFTSYALAYAKQYYSQLIAGQSDDIVMGQVEEMWGQFTGRSVGSAFADLDGTVHRMREAQLHRNRRVVNGEWLST